MKGKLN